MHRRWPADRGTVLRRTWVTVGALGVTLAAGWGWRVSAVHATLVQTREAVQLLETDWGALQPAGNDPNSATRREPADVPPSPADDAFALVRWHEVLREHGLRDWQGRSVSSSQAQAASGSGGGDGVLWHLEGPATFEQGLALLVEMARRFSRLVLLQVQVQQMPSTERLRWHLELRWSAPMPVAAQRWPAGGTLETTRLINPFALDRLPSVDTTLQTASHREQPESTPHHILPSTPLQEIRLVGVVGRAHERLALVEWARPVDRVPGAVTPRPRSAFHRLRAGQTLGLEATRVVSIEPQAVVLQWPPSSAPAQSMGRREVLAMSELAGERLAIDAVQP